MIVDIVFVVLVIILIFAIYRLKFKNDANKIASVQINNVNQQQRPVVRQAPQPQPQRPRWVQAPQNQPQEQKSDEQSQNEQTQAMTITDRKKQLRKQQKSKLKQQKKQALQHYLEEQKQKKQKEQKQQEEKERIQQQKKRKQDQYYRMLAEEQEKRKKAQYEKWKGMFKVEDEGKAKESAQMQLLKKQQLLKNFLRVLQKNKLSLLQDLAHKFKMPTTEVIQKIKQLQTRQQVKGIFDERGKYLVIQQKQWDAIRNYIQARGRLKKIDIMQQCARIIKIPDSNEVDEQMLNLIEKQSQNTNN